MNDTLALSWALGDLVFWLLLGVVALLTLAVGWRARGVPWAARVAAALVAALACGATITVAAHLKLRALGEARLDLERVDATTLTSARRWSASQRRALRLGALSPVHRRAVGRLLELPPREVGPFPPSDEATTARLRAWLRARGDCAHEALLDRRLGDFERAASSGCAGAGGARYAAEAALAAGDAERAWGLLAPARAQVHDGFDGRLLAALDRPAAEALASTPAAPAHERPMWSCVMERLRQRALGDLDVAVWDPMLEGDSAACRILAATAPARRDAASLRALTRLPVPALRAWSSALTASRVLMAVSGKLPPVMCPSRRVAAVGPAWLARYPALAEALLHEARDEGCAFVMDRVWFPAMQARAWNAWADPERPSLDAFEDLTVGWQLVDGAWDRMHTLLDPRFSRAKRVALERLFRGALGPLSSAVVARLDAAWAEGTPWPRGFSWASVIAGFDALPRREGWAYESMLRAHDIPHYAIDGARRWDLDVLRMPAHNPILGAWVDYWRTGTFAPAREAPAWLRDDEMRRLVAVVDEGHARDVLRALDAPTLAHAERLAVVAYRVRDDGRIFEPWLRRAWGGVEPFAGTLADWEEALQTLRTCALRLRIPALRRDLDATLARVRRVRRRSDPFVQAVLDGPRPQPPPDDDDPD